jgi:two-component system OmpR family sensor kinase
METLINGVLELSRLEAGHLTLTRAPVELEALVEETVAEMRDLGDHREIAIAVDAEPLGRPSALDRAKIVQVLQNLVGNALKFTPPHGRIDVRVRRAGGEALVAVEDTGPGIGDEDAAQLFDRWHQAKGGRERGGSGLGLAIARAIVEAHGGQIGAGARSDGERGARFWFTLPLPASASASATAS